MRKRLFLYLILLCAGASLWAQKPSKSTFAVKMPPDSIISVDAQRSPAKRGFAVEMAPDSLIAVGAREFSPQVNDANPVQSDLRLVRVLHVNFEGETQEGALVCNKAIAEDVLDIFRQLYQARYPIERIRPISEFGNDDEQSMRANNTSCFCYRHVAGTQKLSKHAQGLAIDLNPLYNPHVKVRKGRRIVQPATAKRYADRSRSFPHKITRQSLPYRLFREKGFSWGGDWRSSKDYQHFEK